MYFNNKSKINKNWTIVVISVLASVVFVAGVLVYAYPRVRFTTRALFASFATLNTLQKEVADLGAQQVRENRVLDALQNEVADLGAQQASLEGRVLDAL